VKVNKLGITLLIIIAMFGVIPCVCAQNDDPCTRFTDINVQIMCRTMLFGGKGQEGLISFRDGFVKECSMPTEELTSGFSTPLPSTNRSQIMKYAFPSAPSANSNVDGRAVSSADNKKNDQEKEQLQPQKSNTDDNTGRRNIFR